MRLVSELSRLPARVLAALLLVFFTLPALADDAAQREMIDRLFGQLRVAPNAEAAHEIDRQIWTLWQTPTDPVLAERMREALSARAMGDVTGAIALLDTLVADYPDYAEAWNQRATLYYMIGDLEASIADCGKVLELEPRHFGALSGRAVIYLQLGQRALALRDMAAALAIHPFLSERRLFPELGAPMTHV